MAKDSPKKTKKTTAGRGRPKKDFASLEKKIKASAKNEAPKKRGRPAKKTTEKKVASTTRGRGRPKKDFANLEKNISTTKKTTKKVATKKTPAKKKTTPKKAVTKKTTPKTSAKKAGRPKKIVKATSKKTTTSGKKAPKKSEKQTKKNTGFVSHRVEKEKPKGSRFASWLLFFSFLLLLFAVFQTVFENIKQKQTETIIDELRNEVVKEKENIHLIEEEQDPLMEELALLEEKFTNPGSGNSGFIKPEMEKKIIEEDILMVTGTQENIEIINSFQDCIDAGYPVMESYPRQCNDGTNTYTESIEEPLIDTTQEPLQEEPVEVSMYDLPAIDFSRAYTKGEQHPEIEILQKFLTNEGVYTGVIDGSYSPITINAIYIFQQQQELVTENSDPRIRGYFGPSTRYRVNKIIKEKY